MLNPAWRPAQADSPALAVIKKHYKTTTESTMGTLVKAINIPVICAAPSDQLNDEVRYLSSALERQLNLPDTNQTQPDERWILSTRSISPETREQAPELILILMDASLDAIKLAYSRLKPLQHLRETRFSVIIHGEKDVESGRRYYRRLAMGALRFLDLPLMYCGHAPSRGASFSQGIATLAQKVKHSSLTTDLSSPQEIS